MIITNNTTISFRIHDECLLSEKFKVQHPDWVEHCASDWISFTKQKTYAVDVKDGEQDE